MHPSFKLYRKLKYTSRIFFFLLLLNPNQGIHRPTKGLYTQFLKKLTLFFLKTFKGGKSRVRPLQTKLAFFFHQIQQTKTPLNLITTLRAPLPIKPTFLLWVDRVDGQFYSTLMVDDNPDKILDCKNLRFCLINRYLVNGIASLNFYYSNYLLFLQTTLLSRISRGIEKRVVYDLFFKFSGTKLLISLLDPIRKRNYFSLTTGLLLKYFEDRKKSIKKTLPLKLILVRFLRKLLLISKISLFNLWVRGIPLFLPQLFTFLNKALPTPITDPFNHKIINESDFKPMDFTYNSLIFWKSKSFGFQKTKKKGRIKRKIRRKIISEARVIDEA